MITKSTSCSFGAAYEPIQSLRSRQNISARLLIKPYTEKSPLSSVRQRPEHARSVRVTAESSQTAEASSDNAPSTSASAPDKYSSGKMSIINGQGGVKCCFIFLQWVGISIESERAVWSTESFQAQVKCFRLGQGDQEPHVLTASQVLVSWG